MATDLLSALGKIYPSQRLLSRPVELAPYESDALTVFRARPRAVVLPESQEEVIETVRLCHRHRIPFVARGSGTSLSGGSLPVEEGIVIALNRLNRVLRLDPRERIAVVEAGVINLELSRVASAHGLYYAPDPSSQSICTLGGNVAFNSGGAHCLKHGMTSNHVLGIKAVLPDGAVVQLGGESLEGVGPDLAGFFTGSEGLFGIALELVVRLVRKPERYRTLLAAYDSLEAAGEAVAQIIGQGFLPGAIEIMDRLAIEAAEAAVQAGYPRQAAALLIVELEGEAEEVEAEFAGLLEVVRRSGAFETRVAQNEAERARIWKGRKGAFSAVGRLSPDYIVQDGVVPRSRLGEALGTIERLSREHGIRVANVFHAGDGNLHPLILFDGTEPGALERAEEVAGEILKMCIRLGGSITGEHGVGMEKRAYLAQMFSPADLDLMRRVWQAVDPHQLSNRGKMFPPQELSPVPEREEAPASRAGASAGLSDSFRPETVEELKQVVRRVPRLWLRGAGSKPALSGEGQGVRVDLSSLSGVLEYEPEEFTLTALAGTRVSEVEAVLAEKGQFLPFDPILARKGATLGGTVAAGVAGSGRYRSGGIRDFLIGVRFLDGRGELIRGGGKVVKNAAGFDFPKLMVGSRGRLGILVELTFKVFPRPLSSVTLRGDFPDLESALEGMRRVTASPLDLDAVDLEPPGTIFVRIGGRPESLASRATRAREVLGTGTLLEGEEEAALWDTWRELEWVPSGWSLVRVAMTPGRVAVLERALAEEPTRRRYSAAGNAGWVAFPASGSRFPQILQGLGLRATPLLGGAGGEALGAGPGQDFARRIQQALDPQGRLGERFG